MITSTTKKIEGLLDAVIVPFTEEKELKVSLPAGIESVVTALLSGGKLGNECGALVERNVLIDGHFTEVVLVNLGDGQASRREIFLAMAAALKKCKEAKAGTTAVMLDNAVEITGCAKTAQKLCELPYLVAYQFNAYKSVPVENGMNETVFVTDADGFEKILEEAKTVAEGALLARDLVNHPSMYMTPEKLAEESVRIGAECGIEVEIFDKGRMEELGMGSFLAVARGAADEPKMIVMRYHGKNAENAPIALIGKGVMFDSGGYSLKSQMATMHDDMGGAAAVIGAMQAIAEMKLPVNVTAVVAACKNMVSGDAYVPGDILFSMNGKKIEMLNSDAEGRLTLVDAMTFAIRMEGAETLIDIATLTGAAKGAVGARSAALIANDEELAEEITEASDLACEKVWRLPADKELFPVLKSEVADIKNSNPGNTMGGGTIVAGLFLQEFTEGKPWAHIDMAPVNWFAEGNSYCIKGASGYGVSLLYETVKVIAG